MFETIAPSEVVKPWEQAELTAVLRLRHNPSPESKEQSLDEIVSDGAELLDAPMITRFDFAIQNGKTVNKDGEPLQAGWARGTAAKRQRAMRDSRFWLDYQRSCHEENEQISFDEEVVPSFVHNTQITFSPYPQDQEDAYGHNYIDELTYYKRDRKYGLMRIIYQTAPDRAEVVSISVENSHHLAAYHAVAESLGHNAPPDLSPTDWLGEQIQTFVAPEERLEFERSLIKIFDQSLSEQLGGEYHQGRPRLASVEAYTFVLANKDILAVYEHEMDKLAASELAGLELLKATRRVRRSYLASLYKRYQRHDHNLPYVVREADASRHDLTYAEMQSDARAVANAGILLKGACTVLENEDALENMSENDFKQALLSNRESSYKFDTEMYCVVCQAPPKPNDKKKMCGPCGICQPCDKDLRSKETKESKLKAA